MRHSVIRTTSGRPRRWRPAGTDVARWWGTANDFVGESIGPATEQDREILYTRAETTSGGTAKPSIAKARSSSGVPSSALCPRPTARPRP